MPHTSVLAITKCAMKPAPMPASISVRKRICGGKPCSLLTRARDLLRPTVELNLIRVGAELFDYNTETEIAQAIFMTQGIYSTVDFGFGPVRHYEIPLADANGHQYIDDHAEGEALTAEWTVAEDGIDVFLVYGYEGDTVGRSLVRGPCDKDDPGSGPVVAVEHVPEITGIALAHEIGHYLGLWHEADPDNLMFEDVPNAGLLTAEQGAQIRKHCFTRLRCR